MSSRLSVEKRGAIACLTLQSEAIDGPLLRELSDACEWMELEDGVRVVFLAARFKEGSYWSFENRMPPADPFGCLAELSRPVVCAVSGEVMGPALELALACDVRIAAEGTRFGLPEVTMGLLPMAGGTQRLPRLVGRGKALEMILTGERIEAEEALRIGLVSAVVPRERLLAEAEALAARIAERGPLAVRYAKEAVSRGIEMPLEQALRFETDLTIILQTTEDRAEGVKAFLDKRRPEFKGK